MAAVRKIEVCVSNLKLGSKQVCDLVQQTFPTIKVKRWGCMGRCDRCVHVPYVLIDNEVMIEAESSEELWEKVKTYIEEHNEEQA